MIKQNPKIDTVIMLNEEDIEKIVLDRIEFESEELLFRIVNRVSAI